MKRNVEDADGVVRVRAKPEDAVARVRGLRRTLEQRIASGQQPLLTNVERDLLLVAIAKRLDLL